MSAPSQTQSPSQTQITQIPETKVLCVTEFGIMDRYASYYCKEMEKDLLEKRLKWEVGGLEWTCFPLKLKTAKVESEVSVCLELQLARDGYVVKRLKIVEVA